MICFPFAPPALSLLHQKRKKETIWTPIFHLLILTLLCSLANYTGICSSPICLCTRVFAGMGMPHAWGTPMHTTQQYSVRSCFLLRALPQSTINQRLMNLAVFQGPGISCPPVPISPGLWFILPSFLLRLSLLQNMATSLAFSSSIFCLCL